MDKEKLKEWFKKYWYIVVIAVGAVVLFIYARLRANQTANSGELITPVQGVPQTGGSADTGASGGATDTQTTDTLAALANSMQSGFQSLANALQTQQQNEQQELTQLQQSNLQTLQQLQQSNQQSLSSLQDAISKLQNNQQITGALTTLQNEYQQLAGQLSAMNQRAQQQAQMPAGGGAGTFANPVPVPSYNTGGQGPAYGAVFQTPVGTGEVVGSLQTLANWAQGGSQMFGNTAASFSQPAAHWTPAQSAALSSIENAHNMTGAEKLAALKNAGLIQ